MCETRCSPLLIGRLRANVRCVFIQFFGDMLLGSRPNDRDLVRRSWHSIQRERRGGRLLLYPAQAEDRDLVGAD
jgi:hypothetical protein